MGILIEYEKSRRDPLRDVGDTVERTRTIRVHEEIIGYKCGVCERQFKTRRGIHGHLERALEEGWACREPAVPSCSGCGDGDGATYASCLRCAPIVRYVTESTNDDGEDA